MITRKLLAFLSLGLVGASPVPEDQLHAPYKQPHTNFMYNLLFCDNLNLFRAGTAESTPGALATLLSKDPRPRDP